MTTATPELKIEPQLPVLAFNVEQLRAWATGLTERYTNMVVTEDAIVEVKKDMAHPAPEPPSPTLDEAKADAAQQIKDAGYAAEIKGITLQGMTIPTDRESQSMITGAVVGTLLDPTKTTRWQTATTQDGMPIFIELPAPQLQAIGQAVRNHVQRCFDVRDAKFAAVAVLATPKAVADWLTANLATDWPE